MRLTGSVKRSSFLRNFQVPLCDADEDGGFGRSVSEPYAINMIVFPMR